MTTEPGQAAYENWQDVLMRSTPQIQAVPWDDLTDDAQTWWADEERRVDELSALIAEREPLTVRPSDDVKAALAEHSLALEGDWPSIVAKVERERDSLARRCAARFEETEALRALAAEILAAIPEGTAPVTVTFAATQVTSWHARYAALLATATEVTT